MFAIRLRTTWAIKAFRLILLEQRAIVAAGDFLLDQIDRNILDRAPATGGVVIRFDAGF